ncbi:MAG: uroporphyrinogen-III synthase [Hyphomonas sp.]
MTLKVIVTRSQPGAQDTAEELKILRLEPILSPMLKIVPAGFDPQAAEGIRHIIFTSINGVLAVAGAGIPKDIRAWCVGPATGKAATEAGFTHVIEGDGNADDLADMITASVPHGPLLHVANEAAAGTLVATLRAAGYDARFAAPYRTDPAGALVPQALAALEAPAPVVLLIHSAKAAAALAATGAPLSGAAIVAISQAALQPLTGAAGLGEWVARRPNEGDMMKALLRAVAQLAG